MTRYLFITSGGDLTDGGYVLNHEMTQTLHRAGHEVHMVMLGENKVDRGGVPFTELTGDLPEATTSQLSAQKFGIDHTSTKINAHMARAGAARRGDRLGNTDLPAARDSFDVIVGFGDVTGRSALWVRDNLYQDAQVANIITMDVKGLFRNIDLPELEERRTDLQRQVFGASDLVLAHGPKSATDARALVAELPGADSVTPVHEFIPGVRITPADNRAPAPGEDLNILMLGRMNDPNKGAADVVNAVDHLRQSEGVTDIRLTFRGVPDKDRTAFNTYMDQYSVRDWRSYVTVEPFTSSQEDKEVSLRNAHAVIMATESEAYGLAASEAAAHGKPLIVAEGNGNGFATLLQDSERFQASDGRSSQPTEFAEVHVLDDRGTISAQGHHIGEGAEATRDRHEVIAEKLLDLRNDYGRYAESALALQRELARYSPEHMAESVDRAVTERRAGSLQHTKQVGGGANITPAPEVVTRGIDADKHGVVLRTGPPRPMTDRISEVAYKDSPHEHDLHEKRQAARKGALPGGQSGAGDSQRSESPDRSSSSPQKERDGLTAPSGDRSRSQAQSWLTEYWKRAQDLIERGELGPETAPAMLELHAQADRVAAVAYEGQDKQLAQHTWYQKLQKEVFMAGRRGVNNADLPSSPQEYFSAAPDERRRYLEAMRAAPTVRRSARDLASPGDQATATLSQGGNRRNRSSQEGPDLEL